MYVHASIHSMGIKGDLDKTFKGDKRCASAIGVKYPIKPGTVFIGDYTGSPYYISNGFESENKHLMTMPQLKKVWINELRRPIDTQGVVIMCIVKDISSMVPIHKEKERKRRTDSLPHNKKTIKLDDDDELKSSKKTPPALPYSDDTTITEAGVTEPGQPLNPIIDMARIRITRGRAKSQYWDVLYAFTSQYREWPDHVTIIFDYRVDGPRYIMKERGGALVLDGLRHHFGEGDLMIPFYLRWFRDYENILVYNNDSDQVPIILNYLHNVKGDHCHKQLMLQRSRQAPRGEAGKVKYNDMLKLYEGIGPERMAGFQAMLLLAGTDYVFKDTVSVGIGSQWILDYALEHGGDLKPFDLSPLLKETKDTWEPVLCDSAWMRESREGKAEETKDTIVKHTISNMITKVYRAYKADKNRKTFDIPAKWSTGALEMVAFNIQYWAPDWKSVTRNATDDLKVLSTMS